MINQMTYFRNEMVVYFQSEINRKFKDSKKSLNRGRYAHQTAKRGDSREHENSCN